MTVVPKQDSGDRLKRVIDTDRSHCVAKELASQGRAKQRTAVMSYDREEIPFPRHKPTAVISHARTPLCARGSQFIEVGCVKRTTLRDWCVSRTLPRLFPHPSAISPAQLNLSK